VTGFLILCAAVWFLVSAFFFFRALLLRFAVKRKVLETARSADDESQPDLSTMRAVDPENTRRYEVSVKMWGISAAICAASLIAAFTIR
jgi:hypothetical protein